MVVHSCVNVTLYYKKGYRGVSRLSGKEREIKLRSSSYIAFELELHCYNALQQHMALHVVGITSLCISKVLLCESKSVSYTLGDCKYIIFAVTADVRILYGSIQV